jgi:hypothetical protein
VFRPGPARRAFMNQGAAGDEVDWLTPMSRRAEHLRASAPLREQITFFGR